MFRLKKKKTSVKSSGEEAKYFQTCKVEENEEKPQGVLEMCKKWKRYHKAQVIEALLFILRQLLATSSYEDERGRGFLHFSEAFGLNRRVFF